MTKVLLTGANGFIGKNLLELLSGRFHFIAPSRKELDLLSPEQVAKFFQDYGHVDVVIHAASIGGNRSQVALHGVFEGNKQMFLNLAEHHKSFDRMIFLGSGAEYGKQYPIVKAKESDFGNAEPHDEYGRAKYFASQYIASARNIVSLRLFGVFGKYEDYTTRFISNAICRALFGLPIIMRQNAVFDYIYVKDLVNVITHFIVHDPKKKFYNVGRGEGIELLALANIIKSATGGKSEIVIKNPGLGKEYTCDTSLLKSEISGLKFTPIDVAISELTEWYRENLSKIDKSKLDFDV